MDPNLDTLVSAVRALESRPLVVVTGAGISKASGVSTFRGSEPEAEWKINDVEMATARTFDLDPVSQWSWYLQRFAALDSARPNAGHAALVEIERWCEKRSGFQLITQNIDTLHEQAGSRRLIKVHGSADRLRCARTTCVHGAPAGSIKRSRVDLEAFVERPTPDTLPRCPRCDGVLRAHVLFFDELYTEHQDYRFGEVQLAAHQAGVLLFVGTSFSVGVTDLLLRQGEANRIPMYSIDPTEIAPPTRALHTLRQRSEEALPALAARLGMHPA